MTKEGSSGNNDKFEFNFDEPLQRKLQEIGWAKEVADVKDQVGTPNVQWIDVREPREWAMLRIDGSSHIPMGEVAVRQGELAKDKDVMIICLSGERSAAITVELRKNGFDNVYNLTGGLVAWVNQGLPVDRG